MEKNNCKAFKVTLKNCNYNIIREQRKYCRKKLTPMTEKLIRNTVKKQNCKQFLKSKYEISGSLKCKVRCIVVFYYNIAQLKLRCFQWKFVFSLELRLIMR